MLISHRHQFIYTKTAKTAGTSVEVYFEPFCRTDNDEITHATDEYSSEAGIVGFRGAVVPETCRWFNHMPAAKVREQIGEELWSRYFKFCIVRNPFDRAVSAFYHLGKLDPVPDDDKAVDEREAFERWLMKSGPPNDRDKYLINGEFCLDFAIRYEDLDSDMNRVCNRLSLPWIPEKLPRLKSNFRDHSIGLREIYSQRSIEIIRDLYAFELVFFDYSIPF